MSLIVVAFTSLSQVVGTQLAFAAPCPSPVGSIIFIDVGEGDSALIRSGAASALIDAGNLITGNKVLSILRENKITKLEDIILTHPHPDHIGGIFNIAQSIAFGSIHDNGETLGDLSEDLFRWYSDLVRKDKSYSKLKRGDSFKVGDLSVKVVWPTEKSISKDWNTNSIVLVVSYDKFRALLMGDGNFATEAALLNSNKNISAQVLKVGHHGAADASSREFLQRVSPRFSIVSVNKDNIRGYPSAITINRLAQTSKVLRTDESGSITLNICKDGSYDVSAEK